MTTGTYEYKDSFVVIRSMLGGAYTESLTCVCCGKPLKNRECVALLFNNHRYFPNILIHQECLEMLENNKNREGNMKALFQKLEQMYQQYKELKSYFG